MDYGTLKTTIAGYMHRSDLASMVATFVSLAEARIYNGTNEAGRNIRPLRLLDMQDIATSGLPTLPTGFLEVVTLTATQGTVTTELAYHSPASFAPYESGQIEGHYTIRNGEIVMSASPTAYSLLYYKRFADLSADSDTNWLLTNAPNVYLYACLIEACIYVKDDAGIQKYLGLYAAAVAGLQASSDAAKLGSVLVMEFA